MGQYDCAIQGGPKKENLIPAAGDALHGVVSLRGREDHRNGYTTCMDGRRGRRRDGAGEVAILAVRESVECRPVERGNQRGDRMSHKEMLQKYNWEEIFRKIDEVTDELMNIAWELDEEEILHEASMLGAKMQILLGRLKGKMEDER